MLHTFFSSVKQGPRPWLYAGFIGILILLLLVLAINEKNWKPVQEKASWNVTSNYSKELVWRAVDGNLATRWSSYAPMASGMFFQVDVGKALTMNGILLRVDRQHAKAQPLSWQLKASLNGQDWFALDDRPGLTDRGKLVIPFTAVQARYIQIIQSSINSNPRPWYIYELDLLQPIVPWQFSRVTLLNVIVGWLIVMLSITLFGGRKGSLSLTGSMMAVLLAAWFLRSYMLGTYECSEHELRFFQRLAFGRYTESEWLRTYWESFNSGAYWLYLLLVRLVCRLWQTPLMAFRVTAALFSLGAFIAVFWTWRILSRKEDAVWGAFLISAFLSISGRQVLFSRNGDFSASFLCVFFLYFLGAYAFFYMRAPLWSVVGLAVLLLTGICLHPLMGFAPIGLILFGLWHLAVCKYAPAFFSSRHVQSFQARHHLPRLLLYLLSTLPGLLYWRLRLRPQVFEDRAHGEDLMRFFQHECGWIFQDAGLAVWLVGLLCLLGLISIVRGREHGEYFFIAQQGILLLMVLPFLRDEQYASGFSLLILSLGSLFATRGLLSLISFLSFRQHAERVRKIRVILFAVILAYGLTSTASALFFRTDPSVSERVDERMNDCCTANVGSLVQTLQRDPVQCHQIVMLEEQLADFYRAEYHLETAVRSLADLQGLARQGILYHYAFISLRELDRFPDRKRFFSRYYTEVGSSSNMICYRLQEKFSRLPQRYYARNLFLATGKNVRDALSANRLVRAASANDRPGFMVFGPFSRICEAGDYVARFRLRLMEASQKPVALLKVMADRHEVFGAIELSGSDFPRTDVYYDFDIPFSLDFSSHPAYPMKRLEFLVDFYGHAELRVESVELIPVQQKKNSAGNVE
ncbi:hypothetical protein CSB45_00265 [candidate division KSB3 bacterium]|uniref:F5/8 type C domain-containing protein n=1 Tax=candidate division KSB3 bacterium TaxID=2044937 RepID=A0A2G6EEE2_9BACT|nr:MAG: hypothetical protein CSB45_00265 [candidate division KSB3 bacterium]